MSAPGNANRNVKASSATVAEAATEPPPSKVCETPQRNTVLGGRYRLEQKLGEGGMGAVYSAQHTLVGRRFAVKFLHPQLAGNSAVMERFRREAQTAGSLESEHIAARSPFAPGGSRASSSGIPSR